MIKVIAVNELISLGANGETVKSMTCPLCRTKVDTTRNENLLIFCPRCGQILVRKTEPDQI